MKAVAHKTWRVTFDAGPLSAPRPETVTLDYRGYELPDEGVLRAFFEDVMLDRYQNSGHIPSYEGVRSIALIDVRIEMWGMGGPD